MGRRRGGKKNLLTVPQPSLAVPHPMIVLRLVETVGEPVVVTFGKTVITLNVDSVLVTGVVAVAVTMTVLVLPPGLMVGVVLRP